MKAIVLLMTSIVLISCGAGTSKDEAAKSSSIKTKVENVQINKDNSFAWAVTGMIRNISSSDIQGSVKIKFLNSKGEAVHSNNTFLNDGGVIEPNQTGKFEYFVPPNKFDGVTDFDIEFHGR